MDDIHASDGQGPAEALAAVRAARADLARRAKAPLWYHPVLGLLTGGLIAVQVFPLRGGKMIFSNDVGRQPLEFV